MVLESLEWHASFVLKLLSLDSLHALQAEEHILTAKMHSDMKVLSSPFSFPPSLSLSLSLPLPLF